MQGYLSVIHPMGRINRNIVIMGLVLALLALAGCDRVAENEKSRPPVAIAAGDECHVCGMIITNFPGPKAEAFTSTSNVAQKFCSTRELFSYILQPETMPHVREIYVHDMAATDWQHPADSAFVPARSAWYVVGHPLKGAMGPTLASFKTEQDAETFAKKYSGRVLRFEDVTLELLAKMGNKGMGQGSNHMMPGKKNGMQH